MNDACNYLLNGLVFLAQHDKSGNDIELKRTGKPITDVLGMSGHPNAGSIRNSIAHADYDLDFSLTDDTPTLVYSIDATGYDLNSNKLLVLINYQLTLLRAFSAGITLAIFYANTILDQDENMEKLLSATHITDFDDLV